MSCSSWAQYYELNFPTSPQAKELVVLRGNMATDKQKLTQFIASVCKGEELTQHHQWWYWFWQCLWQEQSCRHQMVASSTHVSALHQILIHAIPIPKTTKPTSCNLRGGLQTWLQSTNLHHAREEDKNGTSLLGLPTTWCQGLPLSPLTPVAKLNKSMSQLAQSWWYSH
jgi:hypothetical protein